MPISRNAKKSRQVEIKIGSEKWPENRRKRRCRPAFVEFILIVQFLLVMASFAAVLYYMDMRLKQENGEMMQYYRTLNDKIHLLKATIEKLNVTTTHGKPWNLPVGMFTK